MVLVMFFQDASGGVVISWFILKLMI